MMRFFIVVLVSAISYSLLTAAEVRTTVKYIAQDAVYIDAGRGMGIAVGDRAAVWRANNKIADLEVIFVADRSASCRVIEGTADIKVGDDVVLQTSDQTVLPVDTAAAEPGYDSDTQLALQRSRKPRTNIAHGRVGVQWIAYDDLEATGGDYSQPSLIANTRIERLGGSHYALAVNARARKINRDRDTGSATETAWNNRVYTASLSYDNPETRLSYQAGRFIENEYSGAGFLDGISADFRWKEHFKVGAFGGFEPEQVNTKVSTDAKKLGLGMQYSKSLGASRRISTSAALTGIYDNGNTRREFLYQQFTYSNDRWVIFESASLNLNRGELQDAEGSIAKLTDVLLNVNWRPGRTVTMSLGYDNHRNFRTEDPASLSDSLFDDAVRQGLRGSVAVRPFNHTFVSVIGTLRARDSDFAQGQTVSTSVGMNRIGRTPVGWDAGLTHYTNEYSTGSQQSIRVNAQLLSSWRGEVSIGSDRYDIERESVSISTNWIELDVDFRLARHYFGSLSSEFRRGDGTDANKLIAAMGYRF